MTDEIPVEQGKKRGRKPGTRAARGTSREAAPGFWTRLRQSVRGTRGGESGTDPAAPAPPDSGAAPDHLEALFVTGQYDQLADAVETALRRGRPETPRRAWHYGRTCLEIGQPERLIETAPRFSERSWRHRGFRAQYFQALISLDRIPEAVAFVKESLLLGAFDLEFLLRAVAEYRRLDDRELMVALIDIIHREAGSTIKPSHATFIQNVLSNLDPSRDMLAYSVAAKGEVFRPDGYFLLANLSIRDRDYGTALGHYNRALSGYGLSPAALRDPEGPFAASNLTAGAKVAPYEGPLVTVAMSTFNASDSVLPALMSLSAQSYGNIEVLVVDDRSDDDTAAKVARYAQEVDPRVRLIRLDENGGTYRARNRALAEARGVYFTCNDSDDWSHPEKIATLVEAIEKGSSVAVQSRLIRVNPEMGIKPKRTGYIHDDLSSTLFRREEVVNRIGYYEPVRFGADSEYVARLGLAFAEGIATVQKPLLVAEWSNQTLSANRGTGISDGGIFYPARAAYRHAYRSRHAKGEGIRRGPDGEPIVEAGAAAGNASAGAADPGSVRPGWSLEGSTLLFRDPAIELFWRMPAGFRMPSNAILSLAEALLYKRYGRTIEVEADERAHARDGRVAVAFSGGIDSAAALRLLPDPIPIYTQVNAPSGTHRLDNALLAVEEVGAMRVVSNYDELPAVFGERRGFFGFGAFTVTSVLLADHLNLRTVADGNILDSMYLLSAAGHGTLYTPKDRTAALAMFNRAGLQYCAPCAGLSEVSTELISRGLKYAMGCMRGEGGVPCGQCMKCYRKGALRGQPIPPCPESERVLAREAIPLLGALLWAAEHRGLSHPKLDALRTKDISWVDKWYPKSIEYIPPDLRDFFLARLAHYGIEPITDPRPLETWDSRLSPTVAIADVGDTGD